MRQMAGIACGIGDLEESVSDMGKVFSGDRLGVRPEDAARALRDAPGFVYLDSAVEAAGAISLIAVEPDLVLSGTPGDWHLLESELALRSRPSADLGIPQGAAVGWLGFDGSFSFGFYENPFLFAHGEGRWISGPPPHCRAASASKRAMPDFLPCLDEGAFSSMVLRAKEYIAAGDIYQVCLAHPFRTAFEGDAFGYYQALRQVSPAPYSAFLDLAGVQVASSSPECFLEISGREISTRPIKGTRPRSADPVADERAAYELLTSPKEIAELVMITDLERNDLGRVCEFGTVRVPSMLKLERFQQVHHLVSTVRGTLRPGISHASALLSCSPGGSISGAPKKRALEIIRELEPYPRGLYTGAIGYFGFNGESRFSIAIRTAVFAGGRGEFSVGAGIVADSLPGREWQETLDKAAGLLAAAEFRR